MDRDSGLTNDNQPAAASTGTDDGDLLDSAQHGVQNTNPDPFDLAPRQSGPAITEDAGVQLRNDPEHRSDTIARFPRVLVISTISFNLEAGGGVTMSNLFGGWPRDRIAQIYSYGVKNKDKSVCRTYYHIPAMDRPAAWQEGRPLFAEGIMGRALRRGKARRALRVPAQLQEAIAFARQFKPDVAYCRPMDKPSAYWWLCRDLCRLLGIPYVTHIMDDWPARYAEEAPGGRADGVPGGIRGRLKAQRLDRSLRSLLGDASANIAISPEMAAAYLERYGRRFVPFHNTVDVGRWRSARSTPLPGRPGIDRDFVIRYIGVVTPDKEMHALQEIARAARRLHGAGRRIRMEIHCGPAWNDAVDEHLADPPVVRRGEFIRQPDLPRVLSGADLLVLPMNFDERSMRYVGYSMQTKGPEYMAAGKPIMVYGPPSNPNVRYARDAGWALVVDRHSPDGALLAERIDMMIREPSIGAAVAARAAETVSRNHDVAVVRAGFQELIARVAAGERFH
ncbi:MAG: glycosyltransferase [Phycisphaerales bacterium]